ncbi:MAG: site-specific integrase [Hespellia sp.]|nr:site-specific integrase [Hespellia sp.]
MAIYKDIRNGNVTWRVVFRFTDYKGDHKQSQKRGFLTKRDAMEWERENFLKSNAKLDMTFKSFFEQYKKDMQPRLKENTWDTKEHMVRTKIMPFFAKRKMNEIEAKDVRDWQNDLMQMESQRGKKLAGGYLKSIHAQLSAIFNHAMSYYHLPSNPAKLAGTMGVEGQSEMKFWTKEEYLKFADAMMDKPRSYYAFEMLYWSGIRLGELLALTPADFDFKKCTVRISKSYQRNKGRDLITTPKTPKSNRIVVLPKFLCDEIQEYVRLLYHIEDDVRMFQVSKSYLHHEMDRGAKEAGVERIRVHDLRHSHVSLLIHMGYTALAIGNRVGHEAEKITYRYAHLFPTVQTDMANQLDIERMGKEEEIDG